MFNVEIHWNYMGYVPTILEFENKEDRDRIYTCIADRVGSAVNFSVDLYHEKAYTINCKCVTWIRKT